MRSEERGAALPPLRKGRCPEGAKGSPPRRGVKNRLPLGGEASPTQSLIDEGSSSKAFPGRKCRPLPPHASGIYRQNILKIYRIKVLTEAIDCDIIIFAAEEFLQHDIAGWSSR